MTENSTYEDIINLPHHVSKSHKRMDSISRAAQFSSFAALTGYEDEVAEAARLTDKKRNLTEEEAFLLDEQIALLREKLSENPSVEVEFFEADKRKSGGSYLTYSGILRTIDDYEKKLVFKDGTRISMEKIIKINRSSPLS